MRTAGFVMTAIGIVALVFVIIGLFTSDKGGPVLFFEDSWFPIMFIFWFGAGISVLLTFPAEEKRRDRR